jgi:DNA-binding NarL/FixJ family response regulator
MLRVLLLVADPALSTALLAALEGTGPLRAADAGDDEAAAAALESADWDVCVADATYAEQAAAARRGRGIVVLRAVRPLYIPLTERDLGPDVLLLRVPCSVATLRDAVQLVADTARSSDTDAP